MPTSQPKDQTILITGGAGFIGSHLAAALAADNEVRILDSLTTGRRANIPSEATFIEGDLRDEETLVCATKNVDLIFHEAALVSVQRSIEAPLTSHDINVTATLELLEAARKQDAHVVLASSAAIYGQPDKVPIEEADSKNPTSPYGLEKLTVDHYAQQYHDLYGLDTVALRYFNAYGPRQPAGDYSGVISIFVEQAKNDEPITVHGDGSKLMISFLLRILFRPTSWLPEQNMSVNRIILEPKKASRFVNSLKRSPISWIHPRKSSILTGETVIFVTVSRISQKHETN